MNDASVNDPPAGIRARLEAHGQAHVLRWWQDLEPNRRARLLDQLRTIDLDLIAALLRRDHAKASTSSELDHIRPPRIVPLPESFEDWVDEQQAIEAGEQSLRRGEVAIVLVAGGQGSRLGFDGPKGAFPIGPITDRSLLQIHLEKVLALSRRYAVELPLYLMTSPDNDRETRDFLESHRWFGVNPEQVTLFVQGTMPAVDAGSGRLLLADRDCLALNPNGHGGVLPALADGGHLATMLRRGFRRIFYFQVDNPLAKIADPAFIGGHILAGVELSLKVVRKRRPDERLGVVVEAAGSARVIEYSDLPRSLAEERLADGTLAYSAGSVAIHIFELSFLQQLANSGRMLPFHRALKRVPYVDSLGRRVEPETPNALKFEMFVFDAVSAARRVLVVETPRAEEFEPVKNAEGEDSPATVRQALSNLYADWLMQAGVAVPRRADGSSAIPIEISPLFALDATELRDRWTAAEPPAGPLLLRP